jgi:hypothetical protein
MADNNEEDVPVTEPGADEGSQFTVPGGPTSLPPSGSTAYSPLIGQIGNGAVPGGAGSLSYNGPTAAGHARAQGMIGQIDQRVAAYEAKDAEQTAKDQAAYGAAVGKEQGAIAGLQKPRDDYDAQLAQIDSKRQALYDEAARQTEQARAEAKASAVQFMGKYQQQLAAVRGMTVDVSGPLAKLSTAETGGLTFALFAQGFLAAQGININVSQQIDKWVDRSIHEQERRIQQGEAAAQDTLNLWQIARQNSSDDLEARQRYRGFIIQGLQSQSELAAARFNSKLATAQAAVTAAHLGTEATLTAQNMARQHEQRVFEQKKWETTTAFETEKVNLEQMRVGLEAARVRAAGAGKMEKRQIITDPSTGKAAWIIHEDRINAAKDAEEATKATAQYGAIDKALQNAINFKERVAPGKFGHGKFFDSIDEAKRTYDAMVTDIAIKVGKTDYGTRSTDKEFDRIQNLVPFEKWYQSGGNARVWDVFRENLREEMDQKLLQHADAIPTAQQQTTPHNILNPGALAEHQARERGGLPVEKFAAAESSQVVAKDSNQSAGATGSKLWANFNVDTLGKQVEAAGIPKEKYLANYPGAANPDAPQPGWAVAIDHLANGYVNPEHVKEFGDKNKIYFGTKNETPDEISEESYKALKQLASGETEDGSTVPSTAQQYAEYLLSKSSGQLKTMLERGPQTNASKVVDAPPQALWGQYEPSQSSR